MSSTPSSDQKDGSSGDRELHADSIDTNTLVSRRTTDDEGEASEAHSARSSSGNLTVKPTIGNVNANANETTGEEEETDADGSTAAAPPTAFEGGTEDMEGDKPSAAAVVPDDPLAAKKAAYAQRKARKAKEEEQQREKALEEEGEEEEGEESGGWDDGSKSQYKTDLGILERHDSELTPKQIVEKDIVMYDLLLSHEELMEIKDVKRKEEEEEEQEEEVEVKKEEPLMFDEEFDTSTDEEEIDEEPEEPVEEEEDVQDGQAVDPDDPDNLVNMMMQNAQEMDDDGVNVIFRPELQQDNDVAEALATREGIVGLTLSDETKHFLELEPDVQEWTSKYAWISFKRIKMHLFIYGDKSEFAPFYDQINNYPDFAMLLGLDLGQHTGHPFFLCLTPEARNYVMNPPKKKKVFVDPKKKEEEAWDTLASIVPKKWKSLASEKELDDENIQNSRPLLTMYAYRYAEHFDKEPIFADAKFPSTSDCAYSAFEPKDPTNYPGIERLEVDKGIQVNPPKVSTESQTGFSFKRNKMVQHEVMEIEPEVSEKFQADPNTSNFFLKTRPFIEKALQQNSMLNIMADDYHNLKAAKGHEIEFNNESVLLQEYSTYSDQRHSKGRCVTYMTFHPLLDEVVITAFAEDVTFDKRIDFHSKALMDPNFVLMWDLKDPSKPQLMLDAPSDVFCFQVSPSDPNLIAGGCENGQVVLWDCGRYYIELRNKIQDRKRKESDNSQKPQGFLEKLKDSAEKYVCPLISPAGLSNLDASHKRVVTNVHWIPPHVELGKNGNLYDNLWGGRSAQFFSVAGDSTLRLWDIRVQKVGLEEFDLAPSTSIKVNPWHHLENNNWKYSFKYSLDDGAGQSLFCTIITLSEGKVGDTLVADSDSIVSVASKRSVDDSMISGSGSAVKMKERDKNKDKEKKMSKASGGSGPIPPIASASEDGGGGEPTPVETKASSASQYSGLTGTSGGKSFDGEMDSISTAAAKRSGVTSTTNALTSFFAGTEAGHVALVDWLRNKDGSINPDGSGSKVCQNVYIQQIHDGAITSICRSPFHHDLILVVGGGTISIWKETSAYPILATMGGDMFPENATWSTTRPAVFFCGTREGFLQVWDLMEKSHAPVLTQQVTPGRVCTIATPKSLTNKKHFLAIGDSLGTLIVLLLPRYYTRSQPGENAAIVELMSREQKRMNAWIADSEARDERIHAINQGWKDSRVTKSDKEINEQEVEVEARLAQEYQEFIEYQSKLVGKLKREEPELPTDDLDIDAELEALIADAEKKELERLAKLRKESVQDGEEEEDDDEEE